MGGRWWAGWSGVRGRKWDNCNSIINKYIKKKAIINVNTFIFHEYKIIILLGKTIETYVSGYRRPSNW